MSRPHEILYLLNGLGRGGLENGVVNLLNRLPRDDYRFTVLTLFPVWDLRDRVERPGVRFECVGARAGRDLGLVPRLASKFRALRPDLLHTRNWPTIEGVFAGRLAGIRHVVHGEHGVNVDEAEGLNRRRVTVRRLAYPLTDRVVAVSKAVRDRIREQVGVSSGKVVAIPNGVDTECFRPGAGEETRAELDLPSSARVVGTVGRLDPVKDQRALIAAFASLAAGDPELHLVIVGGGPERDRLQSAASGTGFADRIRFTGPRDDAARLYRAFDLFALPSRTEGLSNTILEALATGLPVVASRVGGNPEILREPWGRLFEVGDVAGLAAAIRSCLEGGNHREEGREAREHVVRNWSLTGMIDGYDRLYRDLLGEQPRKSASR